MDFGFNNDSSSMQVETNKGDGANTFSSASGEDMFSLPSEGVKSSKLSVPRLSMPLVDPITAAYCAFFKSTASFLKSNDEIFSSVCFPPFSIPFFLHSRS
jgi:hypothetical protein